MGNSYLELPVWKRGTVATEPTLEIDALPKFLIDTATRNGMSGAPVVMHRNGFHNPGNLKDSFFAVIESFVGVYSGRYGADSELEAQLGIVWRETVIDEILNKKITSSIDFQNK